MELKSKVQDPDLLHEETMAVSALETIQNLQEEVQGLSVRARSYASYQERFGSSLSQTKRGYYPEYEHFFSFVEGGGVFGGGDGAGRGG